MKGTTDWKPSGAARALSRRQLIALSAFGLSSLTIARAQAQEASAEPAATNAVIMAKAIHDEVDFPVVQAWRVVDWPEGVYSIVRFELQSQASGTKVTLDHTGFPADLAEHLESGWQENYWTALRSYVG